MCRKFSAFTRPSHSCLRLVMAALVVITAFTSAPRARADVIYTFFDTHGNITVEFSSPYIITPTTAPVHVTSFIVAPSGFLPCTASISAATPDIFRCVSATNVEISATTSGPFPTHPGTFTLPFIDILFGFAGDIPGGGGSITPEPASLLLFGTGLGALGLWRSKKKTSI